MLKTVRLAAAVTAAVVLGGLASATGATAQPLAAAAEAAPTTYRVDCSSPKKGNGRTTPWNSLASVTKHGAFGPGDQILFKRGTTCKGRVRPTGSGSAGAPIVLGAYPAGTGALPTLAGGGTPNQTAVVMLENVHDWTVQDLHITNHGASLRTSGSYRAGVAVFNWGIGRAPGIVLQRLHIEKVVSKMSEKGDDSRMWGGIAAVTQGGEGKHGDGFDGLTIRDNVIDHVGRTGVMVTNKEWPKSFDKNVRITGNRISWARSDSIVLRGSVNGRIDHNISTHGADMWPCPECSAVGDSWHASVAIWTAYSRGVRIDHNEVSGTRKKGGDGEGLDVDVSAVNTLLEYNYVHDNEGGGILLCGSTNAIVRFNIFENNAKSTFVFIGNFPAKKSRFYNNTVYQSQASQAGIVRYFNGASGSGIEFYNNVVYSFAKGYYMWPTTVQSRANTYIGTHQAGEPRGAGYSLRDPKLVRAGTGGDGMGSLQGYRPTSPRALGTGVAIPKDVTTDFFGKRIDPKQPPRGAAG